MLRRWLVAAAFVLLLCARARPCRAGDPPADPQDQSYDPADENQDGTVTNREARRYRRKLRRAARPKGSGPSGTVGKEGGAEAVVQDVDDGPTGQTAAGQRGAGALSRAGGAAEALKAALPSADAGAMPDVTGAPAAAKPRGGDAGAAWPQELVLAARGAYAPAFAAAGLKLAADGRTIVRLDGSPASPDDLTRLRRQIDAMPRALERRPDFFGVITPERFNGLKQGYHERPELAQTVYKHVGPTEGDRDLVHTASCAKVSGDCNKNVERPAYHKGDYVAPEDLNRMWDAMEREKAEAEYQAREGLSGPAIKLGAAVDEGTTASAAPDAAGAALHDSKGAAARNAESSAAAAKRWLSSVSLSVLGPAGAGKRRKVVAGLAAAALLMAGGGLALILRSTSSRFPDF